MYIDRVIFVFLIASYFLSPALLSWISNGGTMWYRPYLIWLGIIVINYWLIKGKRENVSSAETEGSQ